ncbi:MAG: NAD-dependent epimerase/dehydratase family protein, partial [Treponema sp.]|nr:NAD-dependent epimerase/dehydratase family protein [Treponema sp.]
MQKIDKKLNLCFEIIIGEKKMSTKKELVLVTGGSGFIAVHTMAKLLQKGYKIRATLRAMSRQEEVKSMLAQAGISNFDDLEFIQADLT